MKNKSQTDLEKKLICPECDSNLSFQENISSGTILECSTCATEIEVLTLEPLTLAPLEEEK